MKRKVKPLKKSCRVKCYGIGLNETEIHGGCFGVVTSIGYFKTCKGQKRFYLVEFVDGGCDWFMRSQLRVRK